MPAEVPLQLMVLWVCGSGCEQLKKKKNKTVVAQELHRGQVKARKQPEFRVAGSHGTAAGTSDKHRRQKGKKLKRKTSFQKDITPQMDKLNELQLLQYWVNCQLQSKLSVKVTPSPKLSYGSYLKHLLSLAMLKVSEKSPSSSSADMSKCAGTEELQQGARGPAHSMCSAPFSASTKDLGMTWDL